MPRYKSRIVEGAVLCCTCRELKGDFGCEGFVAVTDDGGDSGNRGEFLGSALRVAARSDNAGFGILPVRAADVGTRFAISFGGDAAGVDDDHIGFGGEALGGS